MKFNLRGILFVTIGLFFLQTNCLAVPETKDSIQVEKEIGVKKHNPSKATVYSAVLPGLGQIYNKKAWKVPFVWGGLGGLIYTVNFFNNRYVNEKKAYMDFVDNNPNTNSYVKVFYWYDFSKTEYLSQNKDNMIQQIGLDRNRRDVTTLLTIGFYLFNVLDANVNAHLIDFDISEDLSFNVKPFMVEPIGNSPILGGQITFTF